MDENEPPLSMDNVYAIKKFTKHRHHAEVILVGDGYSDAFEHNFFKKANRVEALSVPHQDILLFVGNCSEFPLYSNWVFEYENDYYICNSTKYNGGNVVILDNYDDSIHGKIFPHQG